MSDSNQTQQTSKQKVQKTVDSQQAQKLTTLPQNQNEKPNLGFQTIDQDMQRNLYQNYQQSDHQYQQYQEPYLHTANTGNNNYWSYQNNPWPQNQGFYQPPPQWQMQNHPLMQHVQGCPPNVHGFGHNQPNFQYSPFNNQGFQQFNCSMPFQMCNKTKNRNHQLNEHRGGCPKNFRGGYHKFKEFSHNDINHNDGKWKHKNYKCKWNKQDQAKQKHNSKINDSQEETSSSDDECQKLQKKLNQLSLKQPKQEVIQSFFECLKPFFLKYNVTEGAKHRTINYLLKRYNKTEDLDPLISVLYSLQNDESQYLNSKYFGFFVIVKQAVKKDYNIYQILKTMDKKTKIKQKKQKHDLAFESKYPEAIQIPFLQLQHLMELDFQKTLFLVDGNNIMPKQKIFRKYFQSQYNEQKAEGQLRLRWLFAESLQSQIFFDQRYDEDIYDGIKEYLFSYPELVKVNNSIVYYADKQQNESNTADMKIVTRLTQIVQNSEYNGFDIVLVSADKQLAQLCNAIKPIKRTSGRYIFKYCKNIIKCRNYNNPEMKGIIKKIFTY